MLDKLLCRKTKHTHRVAQ